MNRTLLVILGIALAGGSAGCGEPTNPVAREQLAQRQSSLERTARLLEQQEAERGPKMQKTLDVIAHQHQRDIEKTENNPRIVGELIQEEFDRWEKRQPAYRQRIDELIQGRPETIERTWPLMVY